MNTRSQECVFVGQHSGLVIDGVCDRHRPDAAAVLRGQPSRCEHAVLYSEDCRACGRREAELRVADANAVDAVRQDRGDAAVADLRTRDAVLRHLHRALRNVDVENRLGPNGGEVVATHLGVPLEGRLYRIDIDSVDAIGVHVSAHWGSRLVVRFDGVLDDVARAVAAFFVGAKKRSAKTK